MSFLPSVVSGRILLPYLDLGMGLLGLSGTASRSPWFGWLAWVVGSGTCWEIISQWSLRGISFYSECRWLAAVILMRPVSTLNAALVEEKGAYGLVGCQEGLVLLPPGSPGQCLQVVGLLHDHLLELGGLGPEVEHWVQGHTKDTGVFHSLHRAVVDLDG